MEKIIKNRISILNNNYISVHVRRTDHLPSREKDRTPDEEFFKFIDKFTNNKNLYIATDNLETFNLYYNKYNNRIKFKFPERELFNGKRKTELKDAVIDIYMCVNSDFFMGSYYSSFSDLIKELRKNKKI